MTRDDIKQTIDEFLALVEKGCSPAEENERRLKMLLDKLALAQHFASCRFDQKDYPDAPQRAYEDWRKLVTARFPNYGYYNLAENVTRDVGKSRVIVGDAIDDIADITADLAEAKWCWENNSPDDGLWHFQNDFETHWAQHLRQLQLYLLNLEHG